MAVPRKVAIFALLTCQASSLRSNWRDVFNNIEDKLQRHICSPEYVQMVQLNYICIPLTYQDLYNKEPDFDMLKALLVKYDKQTLLKHVLVLLHNAQSWSKIDVFIENFFSKENGDFVDKLLRQYNETNFELHKISNGVIPQIMVLTKHSCLELLRIIFSINFTGENSNDIATLRLTIFDWLLAINNTTTLTPNCPDNMNEKLKMAYSVLLNILSYNDFTNIEATANFLSQCHKSRLLFEFLNSQENLRQILQMYLQTIGCKCWEEYIYVLVKIFILNYQNDSPITSIVLDEKDTSFLHDKNLFDNFSVSSSDNLSYDKNVDFVSFRNRPIIRFDKNTYWVIDDNFLVNRLYRSLFFGLKKQNELIEEKYKLSNFFQYFTTHFSEEVLFYDVMKHIVGNKSYIHYSGAEMRSKKISGEPDYYIRNGNDIFLFEFKDSSFRKEDKVECDYENVKSSIEEKLVHKRKGKPSAIEQLCNNIGLILNNEFQIDLGIRSDKVRIYPILVVGDTAFTNAGLNFILNDYFKIEISNRNIENKNIRPLTLVSIDSLILYQFDFENKYLKLRNVLDSYLNFLNVEFPYGKKCIYRNILHSYFSLDQYLKDKIPIKSNTYIIGPLIKCFRERGFV